MDQRNDLLAWAMDRRWLCLAPVLAVCVACGGALHRSSEAVASGAVEGTVEQVQEPKTRRALAEILADPEIRTAAAALAGAATAGSLDAITTDEASTARAQFVQALVQEFSAALAESLRTELRPEIAKTVAESVELSLKRALGPEAQAGVHDIARSAARGAVVGFDEATRNVETQSLAEPIGTFARGVAKQAALGFQDAVHVSTAQYDEKANSEGDVLAAVGETADVALSGVPWLIVILVGLLSAGSGAVVVVLMNSRRRPHSPRNAAHGGRPIDGESGRVGT